MRKVKIHVTYSISLAISDEMLVDMDLQPGCTNDELASALKDQYEFEELEMLNGLVYEGPKVKLESLPIDAEVANDAVD